MKKYIKTYFDFFGYTGYEAYIPSELSGKVATDIHHIKPKGRGGKDNIENLIALTREEHNQAHEYKLTEEFLKQTHNKFINNYENNIKL